MTKAEMYGVKASCFHMAPINGDSPQSAFVGISEISKNQYSLHNKNPVLFSHSCENRLQYKDIQLSA